jgi:hypothetical protein
MQPHKYAHACAGSTPRNMQPHKYAHACAGFCTLPITASASQHPPSHTFFANKLTPKTCARTCRLWPTATASAGQQNILTCLLLPSDHIQPTQQLNIGFLPWPAAMQRTWHSTHFCKQAHTHTHTYTHTHTHSLSRTHTRTCRLWPAATASASRRRSLCIGWSRETRMKSTCSKQPAANMVRSKCVSASLYRRCCSFTLGSYVKTAPVPNGQPQIWCVPNM